ncbi:T-cell surface glycoprotein CD8 alpha chain-like [Excalfactoria chinensis]|uniref:T-cell surface glycoprotein CD8 alpha chain-like n=1 Tax=Excalfactoria chinensis TaxID=46218 RepID=UPI003B3A67CB
MAGSPALLLLLSLGLCCTVTHGENSMVVRILNRNMKHPQQGQRLELECLHYNSHEGIFWIRQDNSGNLHFILSSYGWDFTTFHANQRTSNRFEASWRGNTCRLVVKSFQAEDEGTYFCINFINQVLHISSGQPAFLPAAPTTTTATTQSSLVTKNSSQHGLDAGSSHENTPQFCHDTVIWVNLAGTCLLLLLTAITINITHCQTLDTENFITSYTDR